MNCFAHPGDDELLRSSGRRCERCSVDISGAPPNRTVCLNCFRGVMRPAVGDILHLIDPIEAWNIDGIADAVPDLTDTWIAEAEAVTGRRRGRCSFEGCPNMAAVGGHVWLANIGCVIAPICRPCNNPRNMARRQGGGSYLRANIEVFRTHMTAGMRNAERRYTERSERPGRWCRVCGVDISGAPPNHTVCLPCYRQIS